MDCRKAIHHGEITSRRLLEVTTTLVESVSLTVKVNCPVCVGVPEITPVFEFNTNPGGRLDPLGRLQVTGGKPPEKVS
jgi:hypothetical protein